jgi:hypothetical protein
LICIAVVQGIRVSFAVELPALPPILARYIYLAIMQVTTNNCTVGIMFNMEQITDGVSDPGLLDVFLLSDSLNVLEMRLLLVQGGTG